MNDLLTNTIKRRDSFSMKWDYQDLFGGTDEALALWLADMDFPVADAIQKALKERIEHPIYGYSIPPKALFQELIKWQYQEHGWQLEEQDIAVIPGVVQALHLAVQAFTEINEGVVIQSPVYQAFFSAITTNKRRILENPLVEDKGRFVMDLGGLERLFKAGARLLLFCSPHNPSGRVWDFEELQALARLCTAYEVKVCADEIHADLVMPGLRHIPLASVSQEIADLCITLSAVNKTFNLPGLPLALSIIRNKLLAEQFQATLRSTGFGRTINVFAIVAALAAYRGGRPWLTKVIAAIWDNYKFLKNFIEQNMPNIYVSKLEATYLVFCDMRRLGIDHKKLQARLLHEAKVFIQDGSKFGEAGIGFFRINIACSRPTLKSALSRMKQVYDSLSREQVY